MSDSICASCGTTNFGCLESHHVYGRKNSPETVALCPNCHALVERGIVIYDNEESRTAATYIEGLNRFVGPVEHFQILKQFGYKPLFDGEEEFLRSIGEIE